MNLKKSIDSVIMTLDQSFGSLRLIQEKAPISIAGIDLATGTAKSLETLKDAGVKTCLIVLEKLPRQELRQLKQFLPMIDSIIPYSKNLSNTLETSLKQKAVAKTRILFVAADRFMRGKAAKMRCACAPHPAIASLMIKGQTILFIRATGERENFERIPEFIPYFRENTDTGAWCVLAAVSHDALTEMTKRNLCIEVLPLDLATEDPFFIQLNKIDDYNAGKVGKLKLLLVEGSRLLVALGPTQSSDALDFRGAHGYLHILMPSPELLHTVPDSNDTMQSIRLALGRWPQDKFKATKIPYDILIPEIFPTICPSSGVSFQADVDCFTGVSDIDSSGPIISRHIQHPDNSRAVEALLKELNSIGYCAYTHSFCHEGLILKNVIADLPGTGFYRLDPDFLELLRKIFLKYPFPLPPDPWIEKVIQVVGKKWFKEWRLDSLNPVKLRKWLEAIFCLKPWFPWWRKLCLPPGPRSKIVIVGSHFDSTATSTPGYNPLTDAAPGADDNASGIVTTLNIARYMWNFRGTLPHTVRFCFFNAEEHGLVGSKAYAAFMKSVNAPIKAVVCADMLGYNSDENLIFEIHAGYTDVSIRDLSVPIAEAIAAWSSCLGALAPAQIYKGTNAYGGTDRDLYDGAINRSDHAAFHQQGYPAVVVSEDFFANMPLEPGADPNPSYHTQNDTVIDSCYSADITCALAFAVKELAGG